MFHGINFAKFPMQIIAWLAAFCSLFTSIMDMGTAANTPEVELVKEDKLVLNDAMFAGQGITTDGKYYYTSGSITALGIAGLAIWDAETMERVRVNRDAIPSEYRDKYESDHIGGISYYDGKIYAAVENAPEDYPLIITYDCRSLKPIDTYVLPAEMLPDGVPWCAVDGENGYLYCSPFHNIKEILAFDLDTMEYSHSIKLSEQITRIQGCEVYNGKLYASYDASNSNDDCILTVDVKTGKVETLCERSLPSAAGNEAEGLTVFPMADGSLIHVLDYDKTVGVYVRHYKIAE